MLDTIQTFSKKELNEVGQATGLQDFPSIIAFLCRFYFEAHEVPDIKIEKEQVEV